MGSCFPSTRKLSSLPRPILTNKFCNLRRQFISSTHKAIDNMDESKDSPEAPWFLQANWPVLLPKMTELAMPEKDFAEYLSDTVRVKKAGDDPEIHHLPGSKFMEALLTPTPGTTGNYMLTENGDIAFSSSTSALVDLFYELEETISGPRLNQLLQEAWAEDALLALKIMFNARSIHLGKSSRKAFYRCTGWLLHNHPLTLITSLQWLSRPVIAKRVEEKEEDDKEDDAVLADITDGKPEQEEDERTKFDVVNGVSHGYWKDMLNMLALAANGKLGADQDPSEVLNMREARGVGKMKGRSDEEAAKSRRQTTRANRKQEASRLLEEDAVYRALHLSVARLFAEQIKADLALLREGNAQAKRSISLCGKWAPSSDRFHDKHTLVTSSIAEILYPEDLFAGSAVAVADRETYLRYAREYYRRDISALRKHLDVVERNLTANTLSEIKYDQVPSIAMRNYTDIFFRKDTKRFQEYLTEVAEGKARISGATLLPSTLIKPIRQMYYQPCGKRKFGQISSSVVDQVADGQWNTLVQRIKDSGTLESSIAICDVSGSMTGPVFNDGTCPMDSAIGLSLLIAEVTKPPFGGAFITFSADPEIQSIDLTKTLREKYHSLSSARWEVNTDFVGVFERLILPRAIMHKVPPEDMVKRVFVFSDMQFDMAANPSGGGWATCFERIQEQYKAASYEMPELVFWNLAGGRGGYQHYSYGFPAGVPDSHIAPKPATADQEGVSLVSGYSQGMLKMFLDEGMFSDDAEEEEIEAEEEQVEGEDGDPAVVVVKKKQKKDPLSTVKKAVSHKAYDMLVVVD